MFSLKVEGEPEGSPAVSESSPTALEEVGAIFARKMAKSPAWADVLKQKGWDNAYLGGDEFAAFLKSEQVRVTDVLKSIGLPK